MVLTLEEFNEMCEVHGVHTVEIATPDTYGHLRGKRVPVDRFLQRHTNLRAEWQTPSS